MQSQLEKEKTNLSTKNLSLVLEEKSEEIFEKLKSSIDPDYDSFDLNTLKAYFSHFSEKEKFDENIIKIINSYGIKEKISKNPSNSEDDLNEKLDKQIFSDLTTGRQIRSLLFEIDLDQKRQNIEDLIQLYQLMGGNENGISLDNLNKSISKVIDLYTDPNTYFKDDYDPESKKPFSHGEAQEIIQLLGKSTDRLTLEEFVNIMTTDFQGDFESLIIDNLNIIKS
jgi:hypothetical protein